MKKTYTLAATALLLSTTLYPTTSFGWDGPHNGKPIAELDLMEEYELTREAYTPCLTGAIAQQSLKAKSSRPQFSEQGSRAFVSEQTRLISDAFDYIRTIGLVARKKGGGIEPDWAEEMESAALDGHPDTCSTIKNRVFEAFIEKQKMEENKRVTRLRPTMGEKK